MKVHLAAGVRRTELTCLSLSLILALIAVECGCSWEKPGWAKRLSEVETRQGMQGEWRPVYAEENGKEVDKPTVMREQRRVIIDGNSLLMERFKDGAAGVYYGLFEISPETNAFDWMGTDPQGTAVKWIGRYELDDDELKLCFHYNPNGAAVRPTDFSTADAQGSSKTVLYVLKRHGSAPASEKRSVESAVVSVVPPLDRKEPTPSVSSSNGKTATSSGDSLPTRIAEAASGLAASQKSESTDAKVSLVPDLQKKAMEPGVGGRSDQEEGSSSVVNKTTGRSLLASHVSFDQNTKLLTLKYDFSSQTQLADFVFPSGAAGIRNQGLHIEPADAVTHKVGFKEATLKGQFRYGNKDGNQPIMRVTNAPTEIRLDRRVGGTVDELWVHLVSDGKLRVREEIGYALPLNIEWRILMRKTQVAVNGKQIAGTRDNNTEAGRFCLSGGNGGLSVTQLEIVGVPQDDWLTKIENEQSLARHKSDSSVAKVLSVRDLQKEAMEADVGGRSEQVSGSAGVVSQTIGDSILASQVSFDQSTKMLTLKYDFSSQTQLTDFVFPSGAAGIRNRALHIEPADAVTHKVGFKEVTMKGQFRYGNKDGNQPLMRATHAPAEIRLDRRVGGTVDELWVHLLSDGKLRVREEIGYALPLNVEWQIVARKLRLVVNDKQIAGGRDNWTEAGKLCLSGGNGGLSVTQLEIVGVPQDDWLAKIVSKELAAPRLSQAELHDGVVAGVGTSDTASTESRPPAIKKSWLASLHPTETRLQNRWFEVGTVWGTPISHGEHPGYKSIFLHARPNGFSAVTYWLGSRFDVFESGVFVPKVKVEQGDPATPLVFEVWCDGQKKWESRPVTHMNQLQDCRIPVQGVNDLQLRVVCPGRDNWGVAVWFQPCLFNGTR